MRRPQILAAVLVLAAAPVMSVLVVRDVNAHGGDTSLIHSCVNNSDGTLRIVAPTATCRHNETPVDWPASAAPAVNPLRVVDSLDQFVGFPTLVGNQVAREIGGVWFLLPASPTGFHFSDLSPAFLHFEQLDCQGTPYLPVSDSFTRGLGLQGTNVVYPGGTFQVRSILSSSSFGFCFNFGSPLSELTGDIVNFDTSPLSGLVPPFRLEP